ncbi:hypothetical protein ACQEU3_05330 [Spirillospora sp. CA-253888]
MGIRRLAAAGAVSGAALLGAATPAVAAAPHPQQDPPRDTAPKDDPKDGPGGPGTPGDQPVGPPSISASPNPFQPGQNLTIRVRGCKAEPRVTSPNQIFAKGEPTSFDGEGAGVWSAIGGTRADLQPGRTYVSRFTCFTGKGLASMELRTKLPAKPKPPTKPGKPGKPGNPGGKPGFSFGYEDVTLSTRRAVPGAALGIKVVCPVQPRAYSASFAHQPRMEKIQKDTWEGGGRFRSHLPSIVRVTVECPGFGKVSFSSRPGEQDVDPGSPTIPRGAPDTGDGSTVAAANDTAPGGAAPLVAGSLVFLGGSAVLLRRRALREQDVKENG